MLEVNEPDLIVLSNYALPYGIPSLSLRVLLGRKLVALVQSG
jgi:hypothetical protein